MEEKQKQTISIIDRRKITADNIVDVESLSDDYLVLNTKSGKMYIEGHALKINELTEAAGRVSVSGEISGVFFKDSKESANVFKRIFK